MSQARSTDIWARRLTRELVSRHTRFRGRPVQADGRTTLLSVNYDAGDQLRRLLRSFRAFCPGERAVVVENGKLDGAVREAADVYLRPRRNLHHGLGLDYGMRAVRSEWTLVCDPDSALLSKQFLPRMRSLAAKRGVAGIETAHDIYHPICVLFRTEFWKQGGFSFEERWPWWDVGGELTAIVGGRDADTLMRRTTVAGPRFNHPIYLVEVYENLFTNTYLGARIGTDESDALLGLPRSEVVPVHRTWATWVDRVIEGVDPGGSFPFQAGAPDAPSRRGQRSSATDT